MTATETTPNVHRCPPGYRFLLNLWDVHTSDEARAALVRMFGAVKGWKARLERGSRRFSNPERRSFEWKDDGFTAYLPIT